MKATPVIENEHLLDAYLDKHPELQLAGVCICGAVMPATSIPGHIGGSNKHKYVKRGWKPKHRIAGYTVMER